MGGPWCGCQGKPPGFDTPLTIHCLFDRFIAHGVNKKHHAAQRTHFVAHGTPTRSSAASGQWKCTGSPPKAKTSTERRPISCQLPGEAFCGPAQPLAPRSNEGKASRKKGLGVRTSACLRVAQKPLSTGSKWAPFWCGPALVKPNRKTKKREPLSSPRANAEQPSSESPDFRFEEISVCECVLVLKGIKGIIPKRGTHL